MGTALQRRDHSYWVYITTNRSRTSLYTGMTNDLSRRVFEHRHGIVPGFTARYNITQLVYYEWHRYVGDAIAREKEIKGWRKAKKIELISSFNPEWKDLADDVIDFDEGEVPRFCYGERCP
jgi:putative endonuclease